MLQARASSGCSQPTRLAPKWAGLTRSPFSVARPNLSQRVKINCAEVLAKPALNLARNPRRRCLAWPNSNRRRGGESLREKKMPAGSQLACAHQKRTHRLPALSLIRFKETFPATRYHQPQPPRRLKEPHWAYFGRDLFAWLRSLPISSSMRSISGCARPAAFSSAKSSAMDLSQVSEDSGFPLCSR